MIFQWHFNDVLLIIQYCISFYMAIVWICNKLLWLYKMLKNLSPLHKAPPQTEAGVCKQCLTDTVCVFMCVSQECTNSSIIISLSLPASTRPLFLLSASCWPRRSWPRWGQQVCHTHLHIFTSGLWPERGKTINLSPKSSPCVHHFPGRVLSCSLSLYVYNLHLHFTHIQAQISKFSAPAQS